MNPCMIVFVAGFIVLLFFGYFIKSSPKPDSIDFDGKKRTKKKRTRPEQKRKKKAIESDGNKNDDVNGNDESNIEGNDESNIKDNDNNIEYGDNVVSQNVEDINIDHSQENSEEKRKPVVLRITSAPEKKIKSTSGSWAVVQEDPELLKRQKRNKKKKEKEKQMKEIMNEQARAKIPSAKPSTFIPASRSKGVYSVPGKAYQKKAWGNEEENFWGE